MIELKPIQAHDAIDLFPLIYKSKVTDTICWDGPDSLDTFKEGLAEREKQVQAGKIHLFTIIEKQTGHKVGSIDVRPYEQDFIGDMGLWIGETYHGKGYGTMAVSLILDYAFNELNMEKVEAKIFVGNQQSKRIFEKNGFKCEGTIRKCVLKNGQYLDEWLMGILKDEYSKDK